MDRAMAGLCFRGFLIVLDGDCLSWSYQVCASFYLRSDSLLLSWARIVTDQALSGCTSSVPDLLHCWNQGGGDC